MHDLAGPAARQPLPRWLKDDDLALVVTPGGEILRSRACVDAALGVDGSVRVQDGEYAALPESGLYGHFNLERCGHRVGRRYALPRILRPGFYNATTGELARPLLDYGNALVGRCVAVEEGVAYGNLQPRHFARAMRHIVDAESLAAAMLARYAVSLPDVPASEILARGVSFTVLVLESARLPSAPDFSGCA